MLTVSQLALRFDKLRLAPVAMLTAPLLAACGESQPPIGATGAMPQSLAYRSTSSGSKALPYHHTFRYTGSRQVFKVPAGVSSIDVVARGAAGAGQTPCRYGYQCFGLGGRVHAIISVQPGEKLYVFVGGEASSATGGFNGGGNGGSSRGFDSCVGYAGGGASDARQSGDRVSNRILIVGGGGGQGCMRRGAAGVGGAGGGEIGGTGGNPNFYYATGGTGGTQSQGGSGGAGGTGPGYPGYAGRPGTLDKGGRGGQGGHSHGYYSGGGGGGAGGGYYGGGGGGGGASGVASLYGGSGGGGGGGSSYVEPSATNVHMWQGWKNATGNGLVVVSWQ